jgi:TonB family protein
MLKPLLTIILGLFLVNNIFGQKKSDTVMYYVKYPSRIVQKPEDADYIVFITPPDKQIDSTLFIVKGYYPYGKLMFITSTANKNDIVYQGPYIGFYPNKKKMIVKNYDHGLITGNLITYYPNGKVYTVVTYTPGKATFLSECLDSTGVKLASGGGGRWINYDPRFQTILTEGPVKGGMEDGEWQEKIRDSLRVVYQYSKGKIMTSKSVEKSGVEHVFVQKEVNPTFPGGLDALFKFLSKKIEYPLRAEQNNTSGEVLVQFEIEKDGSLTNINVVKGIGDGCDEEAIRAMKLSPKWIPGYQYGIPVRTRYTLPIEFGLNKFR